MCAHSTLLLSSHSPALSLSLSRSVARFSRALFLLVPVGCFQVISHVLLHPHDAYLVHLLSQPLLPQINSVLFCGNELCLGNAKAAHVGFLHQATVHAALQVVAHLVTAHRRDVLVVLQAGVVLLDFTLALPVVVKREGAEVRRPRKDDAAVRGHAVCHDDKGVRRRRAQTKIRRNNSDF
jgi:hypothetical protein